MVKGIRKAGEFCWINMLTSRPEEARGFFESVLGWDYFEMPGLGHGIRVGGHVIGGLFDLDGPQTPPGCQPIIGVMVKVDDADAARQEVISLGGSAGPAFDIFDQGRMSVCHDPDGGKFDLWEPKKMPGMEVDSTLLGAPCWFETLTTEADRATRFYAALFGWVPVANDVLGFPYTTFTLDGADVAGLMPIRAEGPGQGPDWGTCFKVEDAYESAREATALGGELCGAPRNIPGIGRACGIKSPQGVLFSVISDAA